MKQIFLATGHTFSVRQQRKGHTAPSGGSGGVVWPAGEALVQWLGAQRAGTHANLVPEVACGPLGTVLELGAGTGVVSIALALLGSPFQVATDGDPLSCALCERNVAENGATSVVTVPFPWTSAQHLEDTLAHFVGGRCAQCIVCADCVYSAAGAAALELTLRLLLARGGCSLVIIAWVARGEHEEVRHCDPNPNPSAACDLSRARQSLAGSVPRTMPSRSHSLTQSSCRSVCSSAPPTFPATLLPAGAHDASSWAVRSLY